MHKTPAVATLLFAVLALIVLFVYVLGSASVQDSFTNVISSVGLMFALFYAATGAGMAVYYRKLALRSVRGFLELIIVPGASAIFLLWVVVKSVPGLGGWWSPVLKLAYIMIGIGGLLMIWARARNQTDYFSRPIEAYDPDTARDE